MTTPARPIEVPIARLPIDLQQQIRAGDDLVVVEHALGTHTPGSIGRAVAIVIATAGVVSGTIAVFRFPSAAFAEPLRWLPMVLGATALGAIFGHLSRVDFRPKRTDAFVVGATSLVIVRRDSVRVLLAEHITRAPNRILYAGVPVNTGFQTTELTAQLDAAREAAEDAAARAADRWRAAAIGMVALRPAGGARALSGSWLPVVHASLFGFALAVALEAGAGGASTRTLGRWDALVARTEAMQARVVGLRERRVASAIAAGPDAILERLASPDGDDRAARARLVRAFVDHVRTRITAAGTIAELMPPLERAIGTRDARLEGLDAVIATGRARFVELATAAPPDDIDDAQALLVHARSFPIENGLDPLFARYDDLVAPTVNPGNVVALRRRVEAILPNPESARLVPKTHAALRRAAEQLVASADYDDYEDLLAATGLSVASDRMLAQAARRATTLAALDTIAASASHAGSDFKVDAFVRTPLDKELRAAKTAVEYQDLWERVGDYAGAAAIVERAARSRIASLRTVEELTDWVGTDMFEHDDPVGARADQLAASGTTADAHAYLESYAFRRRPQADAIERALPQRCAARFPDRRDVRHLVGLALCKSSDRTLTFSSDSYLGEEVAMSLAKDITRLSGSDRMAIEVREDYGDALVEITVAASASDANDRAQEEADATGKPRPYPCPAEIAWGEDDTIVLKRAFVCSAEPG